MKLTTTIFAAGMLAVGTFSHAAMLADFEYASGYGDNDPATQEDIDGTNGWVASGGGGLLNPDSTSGYAPPGYPPLAGGQSYVLYGGSGYQAKAFGAAAGQVGNGSILSALAGVELLPEDNVNWYAGTHGGLYLSSNLGDTPAGVEFWRTAGPPHTYRFALYGQGGTDVVSTIPYVDDVVYKVEIEMDFTTDTFNGYVTDITNAGPRLLIGTQQFGIGLDAATVASNGGVVITKGLGTTYFDNIEINAIPEPASLSLLGLGALVGLRRRSRS